MQDHQLPITQRCALLGVVFFAAQEYRTDS